MIFYLCLKIFFPIGHHCKMQFSDLLEKSRTACSSSTVWSLVNCQSKNFCVLIIFRKRCKTHSVRNYCLERCCISISQELPLLQEWGVGMRVEQEKLLPGVPEILQNFSQRQILRSLCLVVFHALTLKLPIQTSLSMAPKLKVSLRSSKKMWKIQENEHTPASIRLLLYVGEFFLWYE